MLENISNIVLVLNSLNLIIITLELYKNMFLALADILDYLGLTNLDCYFLSNSPAKTKNEKADLIYIDIGCVGVYKREK